MVAMMPRIFVLAGLIFGSCRAADASAQAGSNLKHVHDGLKRPSGLDDSRIEETVDLEDWHEQFLEGLHHSKIVVDAEDWPMHDWTVDQAGSGGGIPRQMVLSEELLYSAIKAPEPARKEKTAELALRIYYHAKWLAEHNLARPAEWRYREAYRLARQSRRSTLAAHALSRLGYFLIHWRRYSEAREVLEESEQLNSKSNVLGPYLLGVLERQVAGADVKRLLAAEERILNAKPQPSDELEEERRDLLWEITYWRDAELSWRHCFRSTDAARLVICFCSHAFNALQNAFQ